jgi:hypothetical protein
VDNSSPRRPRPTPRPKRRPPAPAPDAAAQHPEARFHPDRRYTALAACGVLGALIAVAFTPDAAGRLLAGAAAFVLAVYVVSDLVFSPRVVATPEGVVINSPFTRARLSWPDIEDVRADSRLRLGLRSTTLEIDAGSTLVAFSRRAIGTDPLLAAEVIQAFRPRE